MRAKIKIFRHVSFCGIESFTYEAEYGSRQATFGTRAEADKWIRERHVEYLISTLAV